MTEMVSNVENLVERAARGEELARQRLLGFYRDRLRRMVHARLDKRLSARVDASDVVQEILIDANRRLEGYLVDRPLPLLAWLRQIAVERVIDTHRRHLGSQRRSVARELEGPPLRDGWAPGPEQLLVNNQTSPSGLVIRAEQGDRVRAAIDRLPPKDREVLVMRHLQHRELEDIAEELGISAGAVKARILRALLRLREILDANG
jgi:RNA polymerase sigma-70 factor (ECF subfamily)